MFIMFIDNDYNGKTKKKLRDKLTAMNGYEIESEIVFIEAFKHLKAEVFKNLKKIIKKSKMDIVINDVKDIQWIVTIPAIWDDVAKNKMKIWIEKAGLTHKYINNHCLLKYEPDCASLSLQNEILSKSTNVNDNNLFDDDVKDNVTRLKGRKYILIDAGGGTVDVACHEFMDYKGNIGVKELFYPTGGPWGDMYVDEAFLNILQHILGNVYIREKNINTDGYIVLINKYFNGNASFVDVITKMLGNDTLQSIYSDKDNVYLTLLDMSEGINSIDIVYKLFGLKLLEKIRNNSHNAYFYLMESFRKSKHGFKDIGNNKFHGIKIPDDFSEAITDNIIDTDDLNDMLETYEYMGHKNCFCFDDDTCILGISSKIWKEYLYDPLIDKLIEHIKGLLSKNILQGCKHLYLVGGYTKNQYYQSRIIDTFGLNSEYKLDIIIPPKPMISVVDGAARMGQLSNNKRTYVAMRVLSKTYGEILDKSYNDKDFNINDYDPKYLKQNTYIDNGIKYLHGWFMIYARKEDSVPFNYKYMFRSKRSNKNQKKITGLVLSSDMINPKTINDGKLLCTFDIIFPDNDDNLYIKTCVIFGETLDIISYTKPKSIKKDGNNTVDKPKKKKIRKKFKVSIKYEWK